MLPWGLNIEEEEQLRGTEGEEFVKELIQAEAKEETNQNKNSGEPTSQELNILCILDNN